jgi:hypothetical protein
MSDKIGDVGILQKRTSLGCWTPAITDLRGRQPPDTKVAPPIHAAQNQIRWGKREQRRDGAAKEGWLEAREHMRMWADGGGSRRTFVAAARPVFRPSGGVENRGIEAVRGEASKRCLAMRRIRIPIDVELNPSTFGLAFFGCAGLT